MHVIGTAGHVDHGKSTLVRKLTGIDPDRFAEEKRRGLTIDLGFAWMTLPSGNEIGVIDVPGHERFIKNMLAGAGGTTICLFVVAANEGWKPQSAEHLAILDVLGTTTGVVALTKVDLIGADSRAAVVADVEQRLRASSLRDAPIVPCSAVTGEGLDALVSQLDRAVTSAEPERDTGRPRLWIDRVFSISGAGTVVTGTLAGGKLATGDEVSIVPSERRARIRGIQSHKKKVDYIEPGNRVALNLAGLERDNTERGEAVVRPHQWPSTRRLHARIHVLDAELAGRTHELREKGAHLLYAGTAETPTRIRLLERDRVPAGESAFAQLDLRDPLPIGPGDRFVLRDAGRVVTLGGGVVLDPSPTLRRTGPDVAAHLARINDAAPAMALRQLVDAEGLVKTEEALFRSGAAREVDLPLELGGYFVSQSKFEEMRSRTIGEVKAFHSSDPLRPGIDREELRAKLGIEEHNLFEQLLASIPDVVSRGRHVSAADHEASLDEDQRAQRDRVLGILEAGGLQPPLTKDISSAEQALLPSLAERGDVVRIGDFYLSSQQAEQVKSTVVHFISENGPASVAQLRDALQTTRKYAVPLCEWLDATGVTRRREDLRVLGPNAAPSG